MVMEVVRALEEAGVDVRVLRRKNPRSNSVLVLSLDGKRAEFELHERQSRLYPGDVRKLASQVGTARRSPMLIAPFVSARLGDALIRAGWSWTDAAGNFDIKAPGLRLRQRLKQHRPPPEKRALPQGAGSTAILRWLLSNAPIGEKLNASQLMEVGGVSQPRVSQLLRALTRQNLVVHEGRSYRLETVAPLLDAFLRDYSGPNGSERPTYSLDSPNLFATKAVETLAKTLPPGDFAFSADVGADLVSPWRKPTHTILYLRQSINVETLGLVGASGRLDANVLLRMPADTSLFSGTTLRQESTSIPLVDVPQMMWDLLDLGGEDREEAAGKLREWFIQHRMTS